MDCREITGLPWFKQGERVFSGEHDLSDTCAALQPLCRHCIDPSKRNQRDFTHALYQCQVIRTFLRVPGGSHVTENIWIKHREKVAFNPDNWTIYTWKFFYYIILNYFIKPTWTCVNKKNPGWIKINFCNVAILFQLIYFNNKTIFKIVQFYSMCQQTVTMLCEFACWEILKIYYKLIVIYLN